MGLLSRDSRGFAFSLDLLLAIIPLTLVLGFVAADMDNLLYQMEDTVFRSSMDRSASDAVTTLVTTSGDPVTWERTGNPSVVGLAQYDTTKGAPIEGLMDPIKLGAVTQPQIQSLIGPNYDFYMIVQTINKTGSPMTLRTLGNSSYASAKDIVRVQRDFRASKFKVVSSLVGQIRYTGGIRNYNIPPFETSYGMNQTYDYWIFLSNNVGFTAASVSINNNAINFTSANINTPTMINSNYLKLNASNPNQFYNNTVTMNATGAFPSSIDIYIVQAPKGTLSSDINIDTVVPKYSSMVFYLWLKGG